MNAIKLSSEQFMSRELKFHCAFISDLNVSTTPHSHNFYEVFLIVRGEIAHIVNNRELVLPSGSLVLIRPEDVHCFKKQNSAACLMINLAFTQETAYDVLNYLELGTMQFLLKEEMPPSINISNDETKALLNKFENTNTYTEISPMYKNIDFKIILSELISKFYYSLYFEQSSSLPYWLIKLCKEMQDIKNFTGGIKRLYELAGMTPEHISRSFNKYLGETPISYINNLRLGYIKNLLVYSDQKIIDICYNSGFDSLSHFNHVFKKRFNMSPSLYRKINRKKIIPSE